MSSDSKSLELDKESTPEKEAQLFENRDSSELRLKEIANNHEITTMKLNQGMIGKLIGSADANLNFCLILAGSLLSILIILSVAAVFVEHFVELWKSILGALLTVIGYVFGKYHKL